MRCIAATAVAPVWQGSRSACLLVALCLLTAPRPTLLQESLVEDMLGMARGMRDHATHARDLLRQGNEVRATDGARHTLFPLSLTRRFSSPPAAHAARDLLPPPPTLDA